MTPDIVKDLSPAYPVNFIRALEIVLRHEGALSDTPGDAGGETKYGISHRQYPSLNIAALTLADAAAIYYRDWWRRYQFDALPGPIGAKTFDLSVNMGPGSAIACLQRAMRACGEFLRDDGNLGPITVAAVHAANPVALLAAFRSEAAGHYRLLAKNGGCGDQDRNFLNGWLNRAYE